MNTGISCPKHECRVVELSYTEFLVDAGKIKIIVGVTVLSDSLEWNQRR